METLSSRGDDHDKAIELLQFPDDSRVLSGTWLVEIAYTVDSRASVVEAMLGQLAFLSSSGLRNHVSRDDELSVFEFRMSWERIGRKSVGRPADAKQAIGSWKQQCQIVQLAGCVIARDGTECSKIVH